MHQIENENNAQICFDDRNSLSLMPDREKTAEKPPTYYCQRCKNHGLLQLRKRHQMRCPFKNCSCQLCLLIDQRRVVMRTRNQISLLDGVPKYAHQMGHGKLRQKSGKKIRKPRCFLCTGHGKDEVLKNHKRIGCPYEKCQCDTCTLGRQYRCLMAVQTKQRRYQSKDDMVLDFSDEAGSPKSTKNLPSASCSSPADESTPIDLSPMTSPKRKGFFIKDILNKSNDESCEQSATLSLTVGKSKSPLIDQVEQSAFVMPDELQQFLLFVASCGLRDPPSKNLVQFPSYF